MTRFLVPLTVLLVLVEVQAKHGKGGRGFLNYREVQEKHDEPEEIPIAKFKIPDKRVRHEAEQALLQEDQVEEDKPQSKKVDLACVTTGPGCINQCTGVSPGNHQRCNSCNGYALCTSGHIYMQMPCPGSLVWDNKLKLCRYAHAVFTCLSCLNGKKAYHYLIDLHLNILGHGAHEYFHWLNKPPQEPSHDTDCARRGTLVMKKPKCATSLRIYINFHNYISGYTVHISDMMFADGWGDFDHTGGMFPGFDIHTYDGFMYAFTNTPGVGSRQVLTEHITSDVLMVIDSVVDYTNFHIPGESSRSHPANSRPLGTAVLGINQVGGVQSRHGMGACRFWISWLCEN